LCIDGYYRSETKCLKCPENYTTCISQYFWYNCKENNCYDEWKYIQYNNITNCHNKTNKMIYRMW